MMNSAIGTFALLAFGFATWAIPGKVDPTPDPALSTLYFPPSGTWERKSPNELGVDAVKLADAIAYAEAHETERELDFSDQERIFGRMLGSLPTRRAKTNGLVILRGYVIAEFGETTAVDPTYSVAKSLLSTIAGVAQRDGRIANLDEPVGVRVHDGGYDAPHNAGVTWAMHLHQDSEWDGEIWGKKSDFLGVTEFGEGARPPRELRAPGTYYEYNDVRVNRFALSMLRVFGKPLPDVFDSEVMQPIGASSTWKWVPYTNSYVTIDGRRMASVSGGTRWGGGVWIDSWDLARFGLLWARGGKWGERQVLPPEYVKRALSPSEHGPDYGFLFWLNTQGKNFPGLPSNVFGALGAGSNTITISPDHDLVVVWRWHSGNSAELVKRVIAAMR